MLPRLLATMASGVLAWLLTGIALNRLDVHGLDWIMALTPVAVLFTAFAVGGVANAINIIDGFHGLASGTTIIALLALAAICLRADDPQLALACIMVAAAVGGFWLVNYPWGKLFMGDGGAYFVGLCAGLAGGAAAGAQPRGVRVGADAGVRLSRDRGAVQRGAAPHQRRQSPGAPDSRHLHSLIKTQFIRKKLPYANKAVQHAAVSPIAWTFTSVPAFLRSHYSTGLYC